MPCWAQTSAVPGRPTGRCLSNVLHGPSRVQRAQQLGAQLLESLGVDSILAPSFVAVTLNKLNLNSSLYVMGLSLTP